MPGKPRKADEHMFSVELKSKEHLRNLAFSNTEGGNVLVEGFLGRLENLRITEGLMLEINGANGTLRMDFTEKELARLLPKGTLIPKNPAKEAEEE